MINIYVRVKAIAKKKPIIDELCYELPDNTITASDELISWLVRCEVKKYNQKKPAQMVFKYLTDESIGDQSATGKIGFGDRQNDLEQNEEEAVKNALQCYEDGIYKVFLNEQEVTYKETITLKSEDRLTFLRLTMLAGRLW